MGVSVSGRGLEKKPKANPATGNGSFECTNFWVLKPEVHHPFHAARHTLLQTEMCVVFFLE